MKKLLLVLLVVTLASFLLIGCTPTTPTEGEGEGEGETEFLTIAVDGAVLIDGIKYVSGGTHDITVTFSSPMPTVLSLPVQPFSAAAMNLQILKLVLISKAPAM